LLRKNFRGDEQKLENYNTFANAFYTTKPIAMENNQNDFHVSFFKPVTNKARRNRNMIFWLVAIWAIAVFGFQILLRLVEKPVAEPAYESFMSVWDQIQAGDANQSDLKTFANSVLAVLGKVYIKPANKEALENAFTWSVFQLADENESALLMDLIEDFRGKAETSDGITAPDYLAAKGALETEVAGILGVAADDPLRLVIPFTLARGNPDQVSTRDLEMTETTMGLYLIHNRSFLTDSRFLGFPFHYFYSAVFLLTLFIGLCWAYCFITDRREAKSQSISVDY